MLVFCLAQENLRWLFNLRGLVLYRSLSLDLGYKVMTPQDRLAFDDFLRGLTSEQRRALFERLRTEFPVHTLETTWSAPAEVILEAISRSSSLTKRGVKGIIAEACFYTRVLQPLLSSGWADVTPSNDIPYDFGFRDRSGDVRIQIKLQRSREDVPMRGNQVPRALGFSLDCFVVETQKTRGGSRSGKATRPYRFGDFDVLGVSLYPSLGDWSKLRYTVGTWLIPDRHDSNLICKYQPVPPAPNMEWTDDFLQCVTWFRSGDERRVRTSP